MNAANIIKPALSRGEIQVIGATTLSEYRQYIEKDSALERRFQQVIVEEPSIEDTVEILNGVKKYYEDYHHIHIPSEIIRLAVILSERYITDRFLPDKAIDLLDEASSHLSIHSDVLERYEKAKTARAEAAAQHDAAEAKLNGADPNDAEKTEPIYRQLAELKATEMQLDAELAELQKDLSSVRFGEPDSVGDALDPILANPVIFATDLTRTPLADKIRAAFTAMLVPGGVRASLKELA